MSLKKQFLKSKPSCKVTFSVSAKNGNPLQTVHLAGDFNNWDYTETHLKKSKDGRFAKTIELETGKEYQFRYLFDGLQWANEKDADKFVPSYCGDSENSVVIL